MTLAVLTDEQLVAAARDGDDRAFEELYARYRPRIIAFALRLTRDPDRADDLTQEVFISALRRLRGTDRPIAFRAWIYEIARNACIDEHRRTRRLMEVPIERDGVDDWLAHLAGGASPDVAMESKQQLDDLCGAFRGLSERHHRIIVLRELEGKSYSQIGDELGMSKVVVESALFRARRRLSEEFQDLSSGRRCEHIRAIIAAGRAHPDSRLGLRERRRLKHHLAHCRPCRREAYAAGLTAQLKGSGLVQRAAAAILPLPLIRLLRRGGATFHQSIATATSPVAGYAESAASLADPARIAATAATALVAALGGGLIAGVGQAPAGTQRHAPHVLVSHPGESSAPAAGALMARRPAGAPEVAATRRARPQAARLGPPPARTAGPTPRSSRPQSSQPAAGASSTGVTHSTGAQPPVPASGTTSVKVPTPVSGVTSGGQGTLRLPSLRGAVSNTGSAAVQDAHSLAATPGAAVGGAQSTATTKLPGKL